MQATYILSVIATDQATDTEETLPFLEARQSSVTVIVNIIDVNDNDPILTNNYTTVNISEEFPVGGIVYQFSANDADEGENSRFRYEVIGSLNDVFDFDQATGILRTKAALDYETDRSYSVLVQARDYGNMSRNSSVSNLTIYVHDVNDNNPIFNKLQYSVSLPESTQPGFNIINMTVFDGDISAAFSNVLFTFFDPSNSGQFTFNPDGTVYLKSQLDRETRDRYQILVVVRDLSFNEANPREASALLFIDVDDENDNDPVVVRPSGNKMIELQISELSPINTLVYRVSAIDSDLNDPIKYTRTNPMGNEWDHFTLDENTGEIRVNASLSCQERCTYKLNFTAEDSKIPSGKDFGEVSITLVPAANRNGTNLYFLRSLYQKELNEDYNPAANLLMTAAYKDGQLVPNVSYSIVTTDNDVRNLFYVNESGWIGLRQRLDFEQRDIYFFEIYANDTSGVYTGAKTAVIFEIKDVNDFTPILSVSMNKHYINENALAGTIVATLHVRDEDSFTKNSNEITYNMQGGSNFQIVKISETTAFVILTTRFDAEQTEETSFNVSVNDSANLTSNVETIKLIIKDVNDINPMFLAMECMFEIQENNNPTTYIGFVNATDGDRTSPNNEVTYSVLQSSNFSLSINSQTGVISLNESLDYEKTKEIGFTVIATDNALLAPLRRSTAVNCKIMITNLNDENPVWLNTNNITITENTRIGTEIFRVSAVDPDGNPTITYALSNLEKVPFNISQDGAITVSGKLDYELRPTYQFNVSAVQDGVTTSQIRIYVNLINVNDNRPYFLGSPYKEIVPEDLPVNSNITQVLAKKSDSEDNTVRYSLRDYFQNISVPNAPYPLEHPFTINETTGIITNIRSLDHDVIPYYEVPVVAFCIEQPSLIGITIVTVNVTDVNDEKPFFDETPYNITISDSKLIGERVLKVRTTDRDSEPNSMVRYILETPNVPFELNPTTGEITVSSSLRDDGRTFYHLQIIANNNPQFESGDVYVYIERGQETGTGNNTIKIPTKVSYVSIPESEAVTGYEFDLNNGFACFDQPDVNFTLNIVDSNIFGINQNKRVYLLQNLDFETNKTNYIFTRTGHQNQTQCGIEAVHLEITDSNDNFPEFLNLTRIVNVSESTDIGQVITVIQAKDVDERSNGKLLFIIIDSQSIFGITSSPYNTAVIYLASNLDAETSPFHRLNVSVTDQEGKSSQNNMIIDINVLDENDFSPIFFKVKYVFTKEEGPYSNPFIGEVSAGDNDFTSLRKSFKFRIADDVQNIFSINPENGTIIQLQQLDREQKSSYTFVVEAYNTDDSLRIGFTTVEVLVTDVNDNPPVCLDQVTYIYNENKLLGSLLFNIQCADVDTQEMTTWSYNLLSIMPPIATSGQGVRVDNDGGVFITQTLDYEMAKQHQIHISVGDSKFLVNLTFYINVTDANDNRPRFLQRPSTYIQYSINENLPAGQVLNTEGLSAPDADDGENGRVTFSIVPFSDSLPFVINSTTGIITSTAPIDYEKNQMYQFIVNASDHGTPPRADTILISVNVLDLNDNAPNFTQSYYEITILDSTETGYHIVTVLATDADSVRNANNKIVYALKTPTDLVEVDRDTGTVTLKRNASVGVYQIEIIAYNNFPNSSLIDTTIIDLNVVQLIPIRGTKTIVTTYTTIPLRENSPNGPIEISRSGIGRQNYSIEYDGNLSARKFYVTESGDLFLNGTLDYEQEKQIHFAIISESSNTQFVDHVLVKILDENDNPPIWNVTDPYNVFINRDTDTGQIIAVISGSDVDTVSRGKLVYTLLNDANGQFKIETLNDIGFVTLNSEPLLLDSYNLSVSLNDGSNDAIPNSIRLNVQVMSDIVPMFSPSTYDFQVEENTQNVFIGSVTAEALGVALSYSIDHTASIDNVSSLFSLDDNNGSIFVISTLDREQKADYSFIVKATSDISQEFAITSVIVTVLDQNDESPVFISPMIFSVSERLPENSYLFGVRATDEDIGNNGEIRYSIISVQPPINIQINETTGDIMYKSGLNYDVSQVHTIQVLATDQGSPTRETAMNVTLNVIDNNESKIEFTKAVYQNSIYENATFETLVLDVAVTGVPPNDVEYSIMHSFQDFPFFIIPTGRIFVGGSLNYEQRKDYTFPVIATYKNDRTKQAVALVNVKVLNVNDNVPKFIQRTYNLILPESIPEGSEVATVFATDADMDTIYYHITSGNIQGKFRVDAQNGKIHTQSTFNYSNPLERSYEINVTATNDPALPISTNGFDQLTVFITITDIVEEPASYFTEQFVLITLYENQSTNTPFYTPIISNNSCGENLMFSILYSMNKTDINKFTIDQSSGALRITESLNYEEKRFHHFTIQAQCRDTFPSIQSVEILVIDINDNRPYCRDNKTIIVHENTMIGSEISFVRGGDNDAINSNDLLFQIESNISPFSILDNENIGIIYLETTLNNTQKSSYQLTISVSDKLENGQIASTSFSKCLVTITVDRSEKIPLLITFDKLYYHFIEKENEPEGKIIGNITATVNTNMGALIQYSIVETEAAMTFNITQDGRLNLLKELDYEMIIEYVFQVRAYNAELNVEGYVVVIVDVLNVNDNPPTLDLPVTLTLPENMPTNTLIYQINAQDPDQIGSLQFRIESVQPPMNISLQETTGGVYLDGSLDYESAQQHIATVFVRETTTPNNIRVGDIVINVLNVNEYSPEFESSNTLLITLDEHREPGFVISNPATDRDAGAFGMVYYKIIHFDDALFNVTANGDIELIGELNYEEQKSHYFIIEASDGGTPPRRNVRPVTVMVNDINDNSPTFEIDTYNISIPSSIDLGIPILKLSAADLDSGTNGMITYSLVQEGNIGTTFRIDPNTGELSVNQKRVLGELKSFILQVRTQDRNENNPRDGETATIYVTFYEPNRQQPLFSVLYQELSVHENEPPQRIGQSAVVNSNNNIMYTIVTGTSNVENINDLFMIDSNNGSIFTKITFDRENVSSFYSFLVTAQYTDNNILKGYQSVTVNILDRNDNAPKFLGPTNQTVTISIAMRSNHTIALLHIYDDDLIGNFSMRLVTNPQNIFDLQFVNKVGYLYIQNYDDLKSYNNLTVEVVASDSMFESSAFVHINIVDENMEIPLCEFGSPFYQINVEENTGNDTNLANITVKSTTFDNVTYSLYSENDYFSINQGSGVLKVSGKQLDYEMKRVHFFPIVATCSSSSLKVTLTAYTSVQINIHDINDERPEFVKPVNGTIAENLPLGSIVLVLQATDKDSGDNGKITYKISGEVPNLPFSINPVTGILRVSGPIDYEEQQTYRFPVIAENLGIRVFENVEIVVLDTNDNHPRFETQFYSLSVTEGMGQQQLECFDITDRDSGKNAEISYSIFSNNTAVRENFYIDSSGCLFTNKSLDREEKSNYAFIVMVKDNGTPYLTETAEIIVDVIDANDETPTFAAQMYQIRISENTLINTTVFAAEAVDRDIGTNSEITYSITTGNTGSVFEITDEGDVYTVKLLNATLSPYNLTITATDKGTPDSKESSLTLKIEIVEQSVNMPCYPDFKHSSYLAVIDENDQASGIAIVEAECVNNPNAIIRYEITTISLHSEGKFEIDETTGVISVVTNQTIDYEVAKTHTLLIKAYEQTSPRAFSSIIVRVRVNNVNDNPPEFIRLYVPISLARDSKKDTVIATVQATDKDSKDISYRFSQQSDLFGVNSSTGYITLLRTISFDDIKNYRFFMIASDSTFESDRATIEIKIYPDNMHRPEFLAFPKIVTFRENENAGSLVYDVDATDKDKNLPSEVIDNRPESDNFGKVSYHLLNTTAKDYFSISPDFGQIRNTKVIDREIHSSFELLVEIRDGGSPPRIAVGSMIVNILDENDEDPVFDIPTFVFSISKNSQIGSSISTIRAKDGDTGSNAQLEYAIVSGNVDNKFKIDENSGLITVNGSLKGISQQVYVLEIFVKDVTDNPRTNSVNITINVIKANGETPIFDLPVYEYYVPEEKDVILGTVSASTSNQNDLITYSIKRGNDSNHFTIDPITSDSGTQLSFSNGDYEMQREYYVVIEAFIGSYSDVALVRVIMIDINDNAPVFVDKMIEVNISENANIGSIVAVLRANDEDDKNNGMVTFKLETTSSLFSISSYTGEIRVTGNLDYEIKTFYMLNITLMDSGDPPLVSKEDAVVKITITDENDNNPTFDKSFDSIKIFKNRTEGVLYSVAFTDKDSGSNGEIIYSMTDYRNMTYFSINSTTGSISLVESLQNVAVSSFRLNVIASDKGTPSRQGIFNLRIDIVDPLSPSPVFYPTTYNVEINENRLKDSLIVKLNVLNVDVNKNNLTFEIISGDDDNYFSVNSKGELLLKKNISEEDSMFKITVAVKNNDNDKEGTNEAVVNIKIRDINNNNPLFSQSSYSFGIEETAAVGNEVGRISASDSDDGSQITYSISDTENTFRVDQDGFIFLNSTVNAFERNEYKFVGYASDNDDVERISSVPVIVIITDVNEPPMFNPATYNVTVSELLDINSYIISVSVQDRDLGDNGNFALSIESGNTNDTFKLDKNRLLLNKLLNHESIDFYQLILTATDGGIPPLSSTSNISIFVANKNEHRPIFSNNSYSITINETQFNTTLIHVSANDADNNANIAYSIEEGLDSHYFSINSNTGEIRNSRFDILLKTTFSVSIKATDQRYPKDFSRAILTVTVLDVNDNPPVFTQTAYVFNISDATPIGTTIGKVEATDADVTIFGKVNYSLSTSGIPFALAGNYIILTEKVDFTKTPSYDFKIIATDSGGKDQGSLYASTDVTVNIETTKGTAPQFLQELYEVSVYSNITSSKIIVYVKAIDNDGNGFNNIVYSINRDSSNKFKIDSNSGAISLQDEERLEPNPHKYKIILHVNATDNIGLYDNAYVVITILPINGNNSPIFNPMEYDVTIHNRTILGTTILRVFASDPDGTPVLYNISAGNEESLFGINNMTGEIFLKQSPQDPQRKIYRLGISATDDSGNGYKTKVDAKVLINVIYLNPNVLCELAPKFSQGSYNVSVNENSKEMGILNISASGHSKIDYSIVSSISAIKDSFTIDMSSGEISTVKELNFESQSVYQFQVRADDTNLNLHSFAVVVVNVTDINEAPIFPKGDIERSITQLASKGHFVAFVEVTDQDKNKNGEIAFSFDPVSVNEIFNIDPNGFITLKSKLKDADSPYEYKLIAVDGGGLRANISVKINLINETVPEFTSRTFSFTMNESMMANVDVGSLSIVAINVPIRYRISVDKSNSPFSVNNINGTISSTIAIDYEKDPQQYSLCVDVYLLSDPSIYDTAVVDIKIEDINDNSPKFSRLSYNVIIPIEVYKGYVVTQVFASDSDELFGKITYKIIDGNKGNNFDINGTSGDIKIVQDNPMFAYNNYSLIIEAEDNGGLKSETNATIFIQIKTDNKNASPKFTNKIYSFTMNESQAANFNFGSLSISSIDSPVKFRIQGNNYTNPFSLNETDGTISTKQAIDYETDPNQYSFCVEVFLVSNPSVYDTAVVNIKINDINDNNPKFSRSLYSVIIPSDVNVGYIVVKVDAADADELFGQITYNITDGNGGNFNINKTSGEIMITDVNFTQDTYNLIVKAEDNGGLTSETNANISIQVKKLVQNTSLKFANKIFSFTMNESQPANFNVGGLNISSIDSPVKFRIQDNNYTGPFSVNETDGTISTRQAIDYETDPNQYSFCVEVLLVSNPSVYDTAVVNIKLNDINDNKPKFSRSLYSVIILSDVNVGYIVVKVDATDADELFGQITYKIIGGNSGNFDIDEASGEIMVTNVDFAQDNYNLIIEAEDNGALTSETNATVSIEIKTVAQDAEFAFDNSSYLLTRTKILANETLNLIISGTVEPPETLIAYMLKDTSNNFVIMENGTIWAINTIDSSQEFCVLAKNAENGKILDVAEVEIIIVNNSTSVSFINFVPTVPRISQNTLVGSIIAVAKAVNFNNAITYALKGGDDFFIIDAGVVTLNKSLKVENLTTPINLTITASDGYFNKSADLVIDIIKENIYNPKLLLNNITINPNEGKIINVTLGVSDPDGDMLVYNIIGEEARRYFYITVDGRLKSNEILDYENKTQHEFCIEIKDSNSDNARAVILPVSISVQNIPDSAPIFPSPPYRVQVPYTWPPNIELITVTAIDPEGQPLTYELENNLTYFKIDPKTAVITLDKGLTESGNSILTVIANNGLKTTSQNVSLTFDSVRELDTVFSQVQFSSITETSLAIEMNVTEHFGVENYTKITKIYVYNQEYDPNIPNSK